MNLFSSRRESNPTPAAKSSRIVFDGEYAKWKFLEDKIEFLIISTGEFIVFLDKDMDVDWSLRSDGDEQDDLGKIPGFNSALNRAAALETTPCDEMQPGMKLHFKRLIGEGIARALARDFVGAQTILQSADDYIQARSQETSRFWYLSASAAIAFWFIGLGCILWFTRNWMQLEFGATAFWLMLSGCAGAVGALLSVIGRTGKQHFDCSAGKRLHYLEAASRIWAGAISGVLVGLAVHTGIFLSALARNGNMPTIMILAALASGLSERLATSIIADLTAANSDTKTGTKA